MVSQRANHTSETDLRERPLFARFARWVERQVGRSSTFVLAIAVVLLWAASGPVFGWSDTWQLVINHRDDHRHIPDGLRDPEHPKPRYAGNAAEIG
jgi:hypothetical protein